LQPGADVIAASKFSQPPREVPHAGPAVVKKPHHDQRRGFTLTRLSY